MKRHPDLRKFSDDHHQGLVRARRLRRTADGEGTPSEEASAFLRFWEEETSPHFGQEEEVLLAVYARHGGDLDAEPVREMVSDHARIRTLVMDCGAKLGPAASTARRCGRSGSA
jgi:hemerythrin-like domain-containing protein